MHPDRHLHDVRLRRALFGGAAAVAMAVIALSAVQGATSVAALAALALALVIGPPGWSRATRGWLVYGLLVMATGGVYSPLLLLVAPLVFAWSARDHALRRYVVHIGTVVIGLWTLVVVELFAPEWLPQDPLGAVPHPLRAILYGATIISGCVLAAMVAGRMLDAAEREAGLGARLNDAADETVDARAEDLVGLLRVVAGTLTEPVHALARRSRALRDAPPEGLSDKLVVLDDEAVRLVGLLEGLDDFARPLVDAECGSIALRAMLEQVAATQQGALEARGVRVVVEGPDLEVHASRAKLMPVWVNLLQNAIQASPDCGAVTVTLAAHDGGARVRIADAGPGIDPAVRARLFTPGATGRSDGSGMGLVISRALAEQHGGRVELDDGEVGAVATVWLPGRPGAAARGRPAASHDPLAPLAVVLSTGPRIGAGLTTALSVLLWVVHGPSPWSIGVSICAALLLALIALGFPATAVQASRLVLGTQVLAMGVTGGLGSIFALAPPIGVAMSRLAVAGPDLRRRVVVLAAVLALFVVDGTGWGPLPILGWGIAPLVGEGPALVAFGVMWSVAAIVGGRAAAAVAAALREALRARRAARSRLAEAHARRSEALLGLASGVAHEIKNPLAAVVGLAALLVDRCPPGDPARETLAQIADEGREVSRTLGRFLDFSRPLSPLTRSPRAVVDALDEAVDIWSDRVAERGGTLRVVAEARPMVSADRRKLGQWAAALIEYAVERLPAEGAATVSVRADAEVARITIAVGPPPGETPAAAVIARTLVEQHGGAFVETDDAIECTLPLSSEESSSHA